MIAAPTPAFRSWTITSTRGSPTSRARCAVSSCERSSTTKIRSTKAGMPRIVSTTRRSSLYAGTTTATDFPSSMRLTLRGGSAGSPERRLPGERREHAEDQPDEDSDHDVVPAALRRRLRRHRGCDDPALLDVLREREQLA